MSTIDALADSNEAVSSLLNPEAQPWFPHSSRGRYTEANQKTDW